MVRINLAYSHLRILATVEYVSHQITRHIATLLLLTGVFLLWRPPASFAATGTFQQINFQGKVVNKTVGTNVTDGSYTFVFTIYDASSGGSTLWTESKSVTVTNGIFQTLLGSSTPLPGSVDFNTDNIYLGINFNADGEMSPRVRFSAVPQAMNALKVAGLTVTNTTGTLTVPNGTTIAFSGANNLTFTTSGVTGLTLPTTGTLSTLAGAESLTNKTIGSTGLVFSGATTDITTTSGETLTLTPGGTGQLSLNSSNTSASAVDINATGTVSGAAITLDTTNGGITLTAAGASNGDITLSPTDDLSINGTAGSILSIGTSNVTQTVAIGLGTNVDVSITDPNWSITGAGVGTFITGSVLGSQTFTTNNIQDSGALTIKSATSNAITLDSGTTGTVNIGTGTSGKQINIGTNNTLADTIAIGSALDAFSLTSTGLNVTSGGALTGVASLDTISFSATAQGFAGAGTITSGAGTNLTLASGTTGIASFDSGTTGNVNLGTGNNAKTINVGTGTAGNNINIGTNNTTKDTLSIGSVLDDVEINSDSWSVTNAGVLTVASCTGCGGGGGNSFTTMNVASGTDPVADSSTDTLNFTDGDGITLTGDSTTDTITIAASLGTAIANSEITADTIDWSAISDAMTLDAATTIAYGATTNSIGLDLNVTNTTATLTSVIGLEITPTIGTLNAADLTLIGLNINPNTNADNDAGDVVYGIQVDTISATSATETGIRFGTGWDNEIQLANAQYINGSSDNDITFTDNGISFNMDFGEDSPGRFAMSTATGFDFASTADGAGAISFGATQGGVSIVGLGTAGEDISFNAFSASLTMNAGEAVTDAVLIDASANNAGIRLIAGDNEATTIADGNDIELKAEDDVILSLTAAGQLRVDAATNVDSTVVSSGTVLYAIDASPGSAGTNYGVYLDYQAINDANANQTQIGMRIDYTNSEDATGDTSYVLSLNNANDASGAATDAILTIENNDANTSVANGIVFLAGGANAPDFVTGLNFDAADFTTEIVLENAETIDNQTDGRITFTTTTVRITGLTSCDTIDTDVNGVLSCGTDSGAGGGAANLQEAYDGDADGSDAIILMTSTDGSIIFQTVAGTQFQVSASIAPTVDLQVLSNAGFGTVTDGVDGLAINFVQGDDADATDTNAGINIALTSSSGDADTLVGLNFENITPGSSTETAIRIGTGFDKDIEFLDTTATVRMADGGSISFTEAGNSVEIAALKEYFSSSNYGVFEAGGFINIDGSYFQDQFMTAATTATADVVNHSVRYGDKHDWVFDEAGTYSIGVGSNAAASYGCSVNQNSVGLGNINGYLQLTPELTTSTAGARGAACRMTMGTQTGAATTGILNVANKWIMYWKVKPTSNWTNARSARAMYFGANNFSMAWHATIPYGTSANPAQGGAAIMMYNGDPTNNNVGSNWRGIVVNGTLANQTGVPCGVSVVTSAFALLRIEARATNDVGFFVDPDISNGISMTNCGNATVNIPSVNINPALNIGNNLATGQVGWGSWSAQVDLFAFVQDDPRDFSSPAPLSLAMSDEPSVPQAPNPIDGADLAENYYFPFEHDIGDIVSLGNKPGDASQSALPYDRRLLGVISQSPGLIIGESHESSAPVAISGRVPTKVNGDGGPIAIGDPITTSTVPGIGMRAKDPGKIVGTAMESFSCLPDSECQGKIMVNVNVGYYLGDEGDTALLVQKEIASIGATLTENEKSALTSTASGSLGVSIEATQGLFAQFMDFTGGMRVSDVFESVGKAIFQGPSEFFAKVLFKERVQFENQVVFNSDSAGNAIIKEGQRFVDVQFEHEYDSEPIVSANLIIPRVTPDNISSYVDRNLCIPGDSVSVCQDKASNAVLAVEVRYAVVSTSKQGFMILLSKETPLEMVFSWNAVAVKNVKTSISKPSVSTGSSVLAPMTTAQPTSTVQPTPLLEPLPTLQPLLPSPGPTESVDAEKTASDSASTE